MNLLGVRLSLLIGPTIAVPAPPAIAEALDAVQVTHGDQGRSGFQLTFQAGRAGPADLVDYALLLNPLLRPFNRVVLVASFDLVPRVLIDGVITHQQVAPSAGGRTAITLTGEDVSVMMDLEEKSAEHPAQDETIIANKIILSYAQYGLLPMVLPPPAIDPPIPIERTPVQRGTDLEHLRTMAQRYGYVFYVTPGPVPLSNVAYWGPPIRAGVVQRALSVDLGPETNVDSISFQYAPLEPVMVAGEVKDRQTNVSMPVRTFFGTRPPLAAMPPLPFNLPNVRTVLPEQTEGLTFVQALTRAQGRTDRSLENVVRADGQLDALRYGGLLQPRSLVGLRGAGYSYDGFYYVKSVSHSIRKGEYKQSFSLTREGVGSTTPAVIP